MAQRLEYGKNSMMMEIKCIINTQKKGSELSVETVQRVQQQEEELVHGREE